MLELLRYEETKIKSITLKELQVLLANQVNKCRGDKRIAIDDGCGHWYWLQTNFKCQEDVIIMDISSYVDDDEYTSEYIDKQPDLKSILQSVNDFITEENKDLELFAEWVGEYDKAMGIPKNVWNFTFDRNKKGADVILKFDETTLVLYN